MNRITLTFIFIICCFSQIFSQTTSFTRQDTLRGSITEERKWWDLTYYHLDISVNPADSTIKGKNIVMYKVLEKNNVIQIDLQPPLILYKAFQNGKVLKIKHEGNVHFIQLVARQIPGAINEIELHYGGKPRVALRPPWDGGITWKKDRNNNPFIASSCQGIGASIWWPCKDHMYDEPDSMLISVTVPEDLIDVSNGKLRKVEAHDNKTKTYHWFVSNPINNYGVNINIADYAHFSEKYQGEKGELDCDYYVLKENLEKAKNQFKQVKLMLAAFEYWFGPYPFYEDGYKLVEAPYLGMEHQSSITYGNGYQNGYLGNDLSRSGWGEKFDFIIIHESGHEWFANSITYKDIADMWIHESFINYSESLFVEYHYGKQAGNEYVVGTRRNIRNDRP
ncbi:MAG: M1 family metallopeptidase, partial [Bacteroidetes bacterium]|nr:M1 family metallopeptidase [Bacteroidota bacterium]